MRSPNPNMLSKKTPSKRGPVNIYKKDMQDKGSSVKSDDEYKGPKVKYEEDYKRGYDDYKRSYRYTNDRSIKPQKKEADIPVTPVILSRTKKDSDVSKVENVKPEVKEEKQKTTDNFVPKRITVPSKIFEAKAIPEQQLHSSVKLLDENLQFCDDFGFSLLDQSQFLVVGVIGHQCSGKSTIASMLANPNIAADFLGLQYVFEPESKDELLRGTHATCGIDVYVTKERVIILDFQPILSPSVMDFVATQEKKNISEYGSTENVVEIDSLQLITLAMTVCHTLLVVQDVTSITSIARMLNSSLMMTPSHVSGAGGREANPHQPHFVFVHNRASPNDFKTIVLNNLEISYREAMNDDGFLLNPHIGVFEGKCEKPLSAFLVPDHEYEHDCAITMKEAIADMRRDIFSVIRNTIHNTATTEKTWFQFVSRSWDVIRKSKLFMEYNSILP